MYWKIKGLADPIRSELRSVSQMKAADPAVHWFVQRRQRPWGLFLLLVMGLGINFVSIVLLVSRWGEAWPVLVCVIYGIFAIPSGLWLLVVVREFALSMVSDTKPFVLVTPEVLVRSDYAHGNLEAYHLRDATDFKSTEEYTGSKQRYTGRMFQFAFSEGKVVIAVRDRAGIAALEAVLREARARKGQALSAAGGASLMPEAGGSAKAPGHRHFTNPVGLFWLAVLAVLILVMLALLVASDFIKRYL